MFPDKFKFSPHRFIIKNATATPAAPAPETHTTTEEARRHPPARARLTGTPSSSFVTDPFPSEVYNHPPVSTEYPPTCSSLHTGPTQQPPGVSSRADTAVIPKFVHQPYRVPVSHHYVQRPLCTVLFHGNTPFTRRATP
eukprot:TRINITY_DN21752_c0_g1_i1.p3 TRINITY_DN21752_c0_g1~~TRINITY_DN21752_c0_g1_i1.p3  ORF type:complete len:139 (+),score=10.95 TRINITY_DN21752_c0_g1_i1:313-729(+)